jgi:pimeloyl-ACP methyl ester carboxylesterase
MERAGETVRSADGTTIAVERFGAGTPLVVVGGALCDRAKTRDTARGLAAHHAVLNYDRRGRGDSGDTAPFAPEREFEDLAAVVAAAGAPAAVYGHSSGAALAMRAAADGVPMTRLVLHDPPYGPDGDEQRREARAYLDALLPALAEGRADDAVALFLALTGLPADVVDGWRGEPWWSAMTAMAPTLRYDAEVLGYGDATGGTPPFDVVRRVPRPTLVLVGSESPEFMVDTARAIVATLPDGHLELLDGQEHAVPPEVLAPVVAKFTAG